MNIRHFSPLRYPGGKASLTSFLEDVIDLNDLRGCQYFEPYAGGAGAALTLLERKAVDEIYINDADVRVFAFWNAVLSETEQFTERILTVPLNMEEWHKQREVCSNPRNHKAFDVGFSAFYMNRCNRSGVLSGAGPIGGLHQLGKWKLDARFSKEALAKRIQQVGKRREQIHVSGLDAIDFLKSSLPVGRMRRKVFVYIDPPYVNKGQKLYLNAYAPKDHAGIAHYLSSQKVLPWLMSYDDSPLVLDLYRERHIFKLPIRYSLQVKKSAAELIICPFDLTLPRSVQIHGVRTTVLQLANPI
jgi:DNA adenine methylase